MITRKRTARKPKATSDDILASGRPRERIAAKWRSLFDYLLELREQLIHRRGELAKVALEEQPAFSSHMADAATDNYDRDFALGLLSAEQDAVYEIDEALNRLRNGKYGVCEVTGKAIEAARLQAIPWTRFSAAAEKQLEREGSLKHARLGPRETVARTQTPEPE
jgi:DnaK suppressor protein